MKILIFSILLSFLGVSTESQRYLITYDLKLRVQTDQPQKYNRTSLRLYVDELSSIYMDQAIYYEYERKKKGESKAPILNAPIMHISYKDYKNQKVHISEFILPKNLGFEQKMMTAKDWKISTEKAKLHNYTCFKATTTYGCRDWVAWFTREVPLSEGPYVFSGLPGLILKLESTDKDFLFDLSEVNLLKKTDVIPRLGKAENLSKEKFITTLKNKGFLKYQYMLTRIPDMQLIKNGESQSKKDTEREFREEDKKNIQIEYKKY